MRELSDDEVFGAPLAPAITLKAVRAQAPVELSDSDVFGAAPAAPIAPTVSTHWTDNLRDPAAGLLKIGPTALKGVVDIARLATNDSVGVDTSNYLQGAMKAIDDTVGSERLRAQKAAVSSVLQSDDFTMGDIPGMIVDNPRAAIDAGISTIGSMLLPTGVAAGAVRALPSVAKVLPVAAKVAPTAVATGATVGTGAAMNAAETFADTEGAHPADRYKGAAISGATSLALGKLLGGGAEGLIARRLAGELGKDTITGIAKSAAKTAVKEGVQEFGEEGSNTIGKQVGKGEEINLNAAAKSGAYGAAIGTALGGGTDVATNAGAMRAQPAVEIDPNAPAVAEPATPRAALSDRLDQLAGRMESQGKTDEAREYRVQAQQARAIERDRTAVDQLLKEADDAAIANAPGATQAGQAQAAMESAAAKGIPAAGAGALEATGLKPKQEGPILQNRDRSTPSSVEQMQSIAANPDYGRLGYSRDFANGAPVVAGGQVEPQYLGSQDMAVASDGRRIPVQYAVVEADTVLPSNTVDGGSNAEYASATDRMRAIAGNGRIAGLQAAAQRGTTAQYRQELAADTMHGVDPQVIAGMRAPVLVRVMPQDQVSADIGDVSNTTGNLSLSAVEQANNDSQRVDLSALEFSEDGGVTAQAVRQFVQGMPQSERGQLLDTNGQPTKQAVDRLHAAVFSRAYGNDQLVRLYAQAQDPEARLILSALAKLSPKFARLEGMGALDIRSIVTEAAEIAVNARRNGTPLAQAAAQIDMAADPLVGTVLQLFARNPRSNREVIEQLGNVADMAYAEATKPDTDMFGEVPKASRAEVLNTLEPRNEPTSTPTVEQPQGRGPLPDDAGRPPAQPPAPANPARAETGGAAGAEAGAVEAGQQRDAGLNQLQTQDASAQTAIEKEAIDKAAGGQTIASRAKALGIKGVRTGMDADGLAKAVRPHLDGERAARLIGAGKLSGLPQYKGISQTDARAFGVMLGANRYSVDTSSHPWVFDGRGVAQADRMVVAGLLKESDARYKHEMTPVGQEVAKRILARNDGDMTVEQMLAELEGPRRSQSERASTGNTADAVRTSLVARFGKTIAVLEQRGFLKIEATGPAGVQGAYDGRAVTLYADGIQAGQEVGVFLHEAGEHASMQAMLGDQYANLVARAHDLVRQGDAVALAAQERIPADTLDQHRDSELLAYMIEEAANAPRAVPPVRKWLADTVAAVRAWFYTTGLQRQLEKFGQGLQLNAADIAALAERAVYWQSNVMDDSANAGDAATQFAKKKDVPANPENLIVAHNLTASNILSAQELGGLPVPSLAVTKADSPIDGFGEVTLVGDTTLATPGAKNPIFDADVYSPRFPRVQVKVDERMVRKALEPLQEIAQSLGVRARGLDAAIDEMARGRLGDAVSRVTYDTGMRLAYAHEVLGKKIEIPRVAPKPVAKAGAPLLEQSPLKEFLAGKTQQDVKNLPPVQSQELAQKIYVALFNKMMAEDMASDQPRGLDETIKLVNRRIGIWADHKIEPGSTDINDELVGVLTPKGEMALRNLMANASAPAQPETGAALDAPVDVVALGRLLDNEVPREQMDAWVREKLAPAMGDKKVVKESGRTAPYTMDNVVREMARKVRDAEGFNYGLGNARSKGATKFKNLAHIQSRRDQVVAKAEFEQARAALDGEFNDLVDAVEPYKTYERESTMEMLAEAVGNSFSKPLGRALTDAGLEGVPAELQGRITTFAEKLRTAPTEYFEAKPQRAVEFSEFAGAVVPKGMDPAARKVLEDAGLQLVEYDKGVEGARASAVDSLTRELHAERGNVRFSKARSTTGGNANALTQTAAAPWHVPEPGTGDAVIRAMQNNKIDLKRLRDELEKQYGQLSDKADAYLNEELYHGKVAARVEALHEEVVKPILAKIAVAGKNAGVTVDDVNLYLHARHAPERNAAMKAINPDMANNDALSGMSDQEAASNIARLRADGKLAALQVIATDVDNLIADTRTNLVADGLEDAAVVQAWESAYQHYVPLQRDVEGQGGGASKGMGFSVKGPEAKRAMGSNREVVNIFANIVAQAETGLIRAEKTKVGRSLLELARQFPNKDFWQVDTPPTKPRINKDTGLVERNAVDPLYQTADNVMMVKDNGGEVHYIVFNDKNERAKMVGAAMKNLGVERLPWAIQQVGHGTRFIASMLTARNPLFWFTNFARDVQGVLLNLEGTEASGLQHKVLANMPKAFKGMHDLVRGQGTGQWAQIAKEMQEAGGTTGYMQQFENSDKRMGDLRAEVERMQQGKADPRKLARNFLEFIDDYNDIVENAVRLAAYKTARDAGMSIPRAASLAKNITVNFNRKGNATPIINSLYMFFNASLQGTARMAEALVKSKKARGIVGGIAAMGFILDLFNRMAAGEDDETGRNRYDMIPEYEKSKNWIIWNPMREGEYIKIPLPLGPHVFHNAGRLMSDAFNRKDARNASEYGWAFASTLFDAFSPLGGAQSMAEMISPSVGDPIIQLENNKSFTGGPVYKSAERGFGADDPNPAYTRYFESTPEIWKQASRMLNDLSGGDDVKRGAINVEPDILKHIAYTLTGGPGRTIDQAVDTAQGAARGQEVGTNRMPFVNRFYGVNDDKQRDRVYYDDKKRIEEAKAAFDNAIKKGRRDLAKEFATELGDGDYAKGMKMMRNAKGTNRELMLLNKRIKLLRERELRGDNVVREMHELQKKRSQVMSRNTKRNDDSPEE